MRQRSIVGPVLVIGLGALLLINNLNFDLDLSRFIGTYWPLLLILAGVQQGHSGFEPNAGKFWLMLSTGGLVLLLLGSLLLLTNLFLMTLKWKIALVKTVAAAVVAPLEQSEVKS